MMCECHQLKKPVRVWMCGFSIKNSNPKKKKKKLRIHIAICNPIFRPNNPMQCNNWAFH